MARILGLGQRVITLMAALGTALLIAWGGLVVWEDPCRRGLEAAPAPAEGARCSSLVEDVVPLVVALGVWLVAVVTLRRNPRNAPLSFFVLSGALAAGSAAAGGSEVAIRLYVILLAWTPIALYILQVRLLGQPRGVHITLTNAALFGFAALLSLPPAVLGPRASLLVPWYPLWGLLTQLGLVLGVAASIALLVWAWRGGCPAATHRPIRIAAYGLAASILPVVLLSILPDLLSLEFRIPYSITLLGLLLLPVMFAHALVLGPDGRAARWVQRIFVYYILLVVQAGVLVGAMAALNALSPHPGENLALLTVLLSVGLVAFLEPIRALLDRLTHWIWFGRASRYVEVVPRLAGTLSVVLDRRALQDVLVDELAAVYGLSAIALLLRDRRDRLVLSAHAGMRALDHLDAPPVAGALLTHLLSANEPVFLEVLRARLSDAPLEESERALLAVEQALIWLPLSSAGCLYGVLLVGSKVDEDWFSAEDLRILGTIAHQSGVAAHNVLLVEELRESRRELERAHRRLITAGEQEQRRLAQDLHDGAVQQLLSVRYQLAELGRALDPGQDEVLAALEDLRDELSAVVSQLREHIGELRPAGLDDLGLAAALVGYAHSLEREYGEAMPRITLDLDDRPMGLSPEMEITLFRVAQEALRNALRHSNAGRIELRLSRGRGHVELRVRDDGCGFVVPPRLSELSGANHYGLVSMAERMTMLSGGLEVVSSPGMGTEVVARLRHRWEVGIGRNN
jgi:signal transduction histidine kinase